MISHADCVASCLALMPHGRVVEAVDYGASMLAWRTPLPALLTSPRLLRVVFEYCQCPKCKGHNGTSMLQAFSSLHIEKALTLNLPGAPSGFLSLVAYGARPQGNALGGVRTARKAAKPRHGTDQTLRSCCRCAVQLGRSRPQM